MYKIIFFGTGKRCTELLEENKYFLRKNKIIAFTDNDTNKWGTKFRGIDVIKPSDICNYEYDFVCIASLRYCESIYKQLVDELHVSAEKVKKENYLSILFEREEKQRHYRESIKTEPRNVDIDMAKIVVYTAIFGQYDTLKEPEYVDKSMKYICFTDNRNLTSDIWKMEYVDSSGETPRRAAKIYKILPHRYFKNYDYSIWIDGSVTIRGDLKKYIKENMTNANILFTAHPWRNCIYDETEYSLKMRIFEGAEEMRNQIEYYQSQGMPKHAGLVSMGFIVRKHNENDIVEAMEDWWREICTFSTQDQISFGFIAWKDNLRIDISDEWIYDNKYIYISDHLIMDEEGRNSG